MRWDNSHMAKQKRPTPRPVDPLLGKDKAAHRLLRGFLDVDYADRLNEKDRAWLAQFLDEFYMSGSRKPGKNVHDDERLRQCWREYKQRQRSGCAILYNQSRELGLNDTCPVRAINRAEDDILERVDQRIARKRADKARHQ